MLGIDAGTTLKVTILAAPERALSPLSSSLMTYAITNNNICAPDIDETNTFLAEIVERLQTEGEIPTRVIKGADARTFDFSEYTTHVSIKRVGTDDPRTECSGIDPELTYLQVVDFEGSNGDTLELNTPAGLTSNLVTIPEEMDDYDDTMKYMRVSKSSKLITFYVDEDEEIDGDLTVRIYISSF